MIIRIVKMTFRSEELSSFLQLFEANKNKIASFAGCSKVELLQDIHNPHICFTYSHWESENALNLYRDSQLFNTVWTQTKSYFADKPEAWSLTAKAK
jgi:quinol monooxygenase YgiN